MANSLTLLMLISAPMWCGAYDCWKCTIPAGEKCKTTEAESCAENEICVKMEMILAEDEIIIERKCIANQTCEQFIAKRFKQGKIRREAQYDTSKAKPGKCEVCFSDRCNGNRVKRRPFFRSNSSIIARTSYFAAMLLIITQLYCAYVYSV